MRNVVLFIFLTALIGCANKQDSSSLTLESADSFYDQLDLQNSRRILTTMAEGDSIDSETRCKVLQKLAFQDWK